MQDNSIHLQKNGNIIIRDEQSGDLAIDSNASKDSLEKNFQSLNDTQIAVIKKLADEHASRLNDTFKTLLSKIISKKNIVYGDISNVQSVRIGDEIHYHYSSEKLLPKELTAKVPKTSQEKIIGRQAELTDLHQRLFDNRQVVLVNGLGGIGKTTLAQVYANKFWDQYHHIAWITQVTQDIVRDFITTEGLLHNLDIHAEGQEPQDIFIQLISTLNKMAEEPNLLIIDNADNSLNKLYDYLPHQPLWHILVTSREQIHNFDLKELSFLSEDEAVDLFLSHYTLGKMTEENIRELVQIVDLHTLTIEILAKTAQRQRSERDALKNAIETDLKANVYVDHKGDKIERVTSYLCSIFSLSQISETELWMLKQFVCLPSEFHDFDMIEDLIEPAAYQQEDIFSETLETLCEKGWLLKNRETDNYKMHRIIVDVIKKQHPVELSQTEHLIENITEKLYIDEAKDNPVEKFVWIPFGKSILSVLFEDGDTLIAELENNLALVLQDLGDYEGAKTLLEKALASDEKNFGPDHPSTAGSCSNLATVLQDLGDYEGALKLSGKALHIVQKVLPEGHPNVQTAYDNYQFIKESYRPAGKITKFIENIYNIYQSIRLKK